MPSPATAAGLLGAGCAYRIAAAQTAQWSPVGNRAVADAVPAPRITPWRWTPEMMTELTLPRRRSAIFTRYDCAPPPEGPATGRTV